MKKNNISRKIRTILSNINMDKIEELPMIVSTTDVYIGQKVIICLPKKHKSSKMTYIYIENVLPLLPKEKEIGYTEDEIITNIGIHIFSKKRSGMCIGRTYPLSTLLSYLGNDLSSKNRLLFKIQQMKTQILINEDFLNISSSIFSCRTMETIN